jgi:hypothetical protein
VAQFRDRTRLKLANRLSGQPKVADNLVKGTRYPPVRHQTEGAGSPADGKPVAAVAPIDDLAIAEGNPFKVSGTSFAERLMTADAWR